MKFDTAVKKRNAAFKKWKAADKRARELRGQVQNWDAKCNTARKMWDSWEPKFPKRCNFSGMED